MTAAATLPKKRMKFIERKLDGGMGMAVAKRTYLRKVDDGSEEGRWETWAEVADRVAKGNTLLLKKYGKKAWISLLPK